MLDQSAKAHVRMATSLVLSSTDLIRGAACSRANRSTTDIGATTKHVLREAMQRVLLEKIPIRTDKIVFAAAEEAWLRRGRPEAFPSTLRAAMEASSCVPSPNALDFLNEVIDGRHSFSLAPWRMISFGAWVKRFDVQVDG